jgi:hypothetical protein
MNLFKQGAQLVAFIIIITILFTGCNSASADLEKYEFYKGERSYENLNPEFQLNKAIAYKAVKDDPSIFQNLPAQLRGDLDIVFAAVIDLQDGAEDDSRLDNINHIFPGLWSNKDFVLAIVKINGLNLEFATVTLKNDKDVVLVAVKQDKSALQFASQNLKTDEDVVAAADKLTVEEKFSRHKPNGKPKTGGKPNGNTKSGSQ